MLNEKLIVVTSYDVNITSTQQRSIKLDFESDGNYKHS